MSSNGAISTPPNPSLAELANLNREQLTVYEQNLLDYWTTRGVIDTAREEGRQEGIQEGELQKALEIAQRLHAKGLNLEEIAQTTGLTKEQLIGLN